MELKPLAKYIKLEELMRFPIRRNHYDKEHGSKDFIYGIETVLEYAENLQTTDVAQEWISVDDRLPDDTGYYLVVYRDKYNRSTSIAFDMYVKCNVGEWWESEFACDITKQFLWATKLQEQEVTHWMPLPQPPKGECL